MSLLDLIFPKKCVNCKRFGDFLCADCFSKIRYNESSQCPVCLKASIDGFTHRECKAEYSIDGVISAVVYSQVTRKMIRQFKYKPYVSGIAETIASIMNEGLAQNESFYHFVEQFGPVAVPIPLSPKRLRERGYNHAEIIASHVAKYFNLVMSNKLLVRIKDTKPQYRLNKEERKKNIEGAFSVRKNPNPPAGGPNIPKAVIIIDDLATSLATLKEAAKVLKRAGSKRVLGVTFAREI